MFWQDEPPAPLPPSVLTTTESDCAWSGGVCLTRAGLKRTVHEMQEAVYAKGLSTRALEMAERRYHQALTALMQHECDDVAMSGLGASASPATVGRAGPAPVDQTVGQPGEPADTPVQLTPVGDEDERSREARSGDTSSRDTSATPTGIDEIERLIDRVCSLHARRHKTPDVDQEYRDARLVLRTRILMLMADRPPRLLEILEANERGSR